MSHNVHRRRALFGRNRVRFPVRVAQHPSSLDAGVEEFAAPA